MLREPWDVSFLARAEEVAALRRDVRLRLAGWGLPELSDIAQLCVSELVANVIKHVGSGTPAALAVSMRGMRLRIEVRDPDARALPTLTEAGADAESGRGMALIEALAERWGVELAADHKVTWCEIGAGAALADEHSVASGVSRAMKVLHFYDTAWEQSKISASPRLGAAMAEDRVIKVIADLLHWLTAHGQDPDAVLDRAQAHFEAETEVR
ncbi:ATP-binding protein [Streptomyces sp. NPDC004065]|uniref:ATP-binding protein n=1 Tax=Streptomyces sp. NPDC004065 TaxID=3364689 RepID=UPI00384DE6F5